MMCSLLLSLGDEFVIDTVSLGDGRCPFVAAGVAVTVSESVAAKTRRQLPIIQVMFGFAL